MPEARPTVLITGIAGNLGMRLLPQLPDFSLVGVDMRPPSAGGLARFEALDLGKESSTLELMRLLRETRASAVVHLAFVIDPVRTGVTEVERMWQINVAGTARVMEAISEINRDQSQVRKFIFPSSVSAYGSDLPGPVQEDFPLRGHSLPYAIHKRESDLVVQQRARELWDCCTYILRPHIYAGASVNNYLLGAFRGTPTGRSARAERWRKQGKRLPCMLPLGQRYRDKLFQFVHVDDVARLIAHILRRSARDPRLTILNVAGRGEPLAVGECIRRSGNRFVPVPTRPLFGAVLRALWRLNISGIPPQVVPYMTGSYIMDTSRLRSFLGHEYEEVIQFTIEQALEDSFRNVLPRAQAPDSPTRSASAR
ncbi:MAG TPA: NAD-dependent epimerase/dehydratase family protein [Terriglobales bacterium]|nr:NAD-dependent epimerase/dehydratase family protein [Terriglobales bacterium]